MKVVEREPVNGWIHFAGALLAAAGLVALIVTASTQDSWRHLAGAIVFGVTALLMFAASANYHLARGSLNGALYRRLDHAMIYVFIAGTFTPVCLVALAESPLSTPLLACVWALALLGVVQEFARRALPRHVGTILYLALGWRGAMTAPALLRTSQGALFAWLLVGGLLYTAGAVFYWRRWPRGRPGTFGFHELWHLFVMAASGSHYWAVLAYVIA